MFPHGYRSNQAHAPLLEDYNVLYPFWLKPGWVSRNRDRPRLGSSVVGEMTPLPYSVGDVLLRAVSTIERHQFDNGIEKSAPHGTRC